MNERDLNPDSSAIALDYRNFGYLPDAERSNWMEGFVTVRETSVPRPQKAIIELLNSCNFDCPMCRVGQYGVNLKRALPFAKFSVILAQLPELKTVRLNGLGESTLLPDFDSYAQAILKRGIRLELITNGSGSIASYQRILNSNGNIIVSWDAADKPTFERLRRPAKWEESTGMLSRLVQHTVDNGKIGSITLLFTLQRTNLGQLERLVSLCLVWGIQRLIVNVVKVERAEWLTENIQAIIQDFAAAKQLAEKSRIKLYIPNEINEMKLGIDGAFSTCSQNCRMPWQEVVIRWNGDIQACNMFNPYIYGNIFLNTFDEIWNNQFASLFRKQINTPRKHPYCRGCVYFDAPYHSLPS